MHGLINRAVQCFVRDTYGTDVWAELGASIGLGTAGFEAMLTYEDETTRAMLKKLASMRDREQADLLEDLGTYLVTHPNTRAIRRLLRFGGQSFLELLFSLDDLPDRARLAVPDLELPGLTLIELEPGRYRLDVSGPYPEFGAVLTGVLRALADDYGALAFLELNTAPAGRTVITIDLLDAEFAEAKRFSLGGGRGPRQEGVE